jgi:hypothetical protein
MTRNRTAKLTMTLPRPTTADFIAARQDWRVRLEHEYQAVSARLQAAYRRTITPLQDQLGTLTTELGNAENLSAEDVRGLRTYRDLLRRIEADMNGFAAITRNELVNLQEGAVQIGLGGAFEQAQAQVSAAQARVLAGAWLRPDPAALSALIDYAESPALRERMAAFGANAADNFADTMLALVAQGKNPRAIARTMTTWFNIPYAWADNQARTIQVYSYRAANHATYRANERILDGWLWRAALDPRTCMSCVSQHGSIHPVSETLNDHHRGRCAPVPVVKGTTWAQEVESGEAWFARQSPAVQRQMMGPGMFDAYQRGRLDFRDLSQPYQDGVYGTMLREATLGELGIRSPRRSQGSPPVPPTPPAAPTPAAPQGPAMGTPVRNALTLPAHPRLSAEFDQALDAIGDVHGDGALPTIPIEVAGKVPGAPGAEAGYGFSGTQARRIVVTRRAKAPQTALIHETGHFIDHQGLGAGQWVSNDAAQGSGVLVPWWNAVTQSPSYRTLVDMRDHPMAYAQPAGQGIMLIPERNLVQYFLEPDELWARSYEQYVTTRANRPVLTNSLTQRQTAPMYAAAYWSDADFVPIANEIETLFQTLGWRR